MSAWHDQVCTGCGAAGARTHMGDQVLCNPCTNRALWGDKDLPLPPDPPQDELVTGPDGVVHRMRYEIGYTVTGPYAEAFEIGGRYGDDAGGFQLRHWGTFGQSFDEVVTLFRAMVHTEIGRTYLEEDDGRLDLVDHEVRGRVGFDEAGPDECGPTVWIDGAPLSWAALGAMLTSYEGWQFHLKLE